MKQWAAKVVASSLSQLNLTQVIHFHQSHNRETTNLAWTKLVIFDLSRMNLSESSKSTVT